jgi:hypothetical protein
LALSLKKNCAGANALVNRPVTILRQNYPIFGSTGAP